jgi:outer membrane lipoprotein carrier protein
MVTGIGRGLAMVLVCALAVVRAQAGDPAKDIMEKVSDRYASITDGELRFTQKTGFALARVEQEVSGTLIFKKTNKYRVEYDGQVVVTDGKTVWSYSPSTNQVLIDNFRLNERSLTPERILGEAPDEYAPTLVGREKIGTMETVVLKLTPPEGSGTLKTMKIWVQEGEWIIRKAELLDLHGKRTTYQVHSMKTNTGVSDTRFTFEAPAGAETVDLR